MSSKKILKRPKKTVLFDSFYKITEVSREIALTKDARKMKNTQYPPLNDRIRYSAVRQRIALNEKEITRKSEAKILGVQY